jgi:competence protein ComFB
MEKLKNIMEEIVYEMMAEVLKEIKVCTCDICYIDMAAKALNDLPAKYFVTEQGKLYKKAEALKEQIEIDVITAITKAAILVKRHPRH